MEDQKQHVIDTLKEATNILVTVRNSPSIDQLAACIALTLIVNELGKHGTAVFSGQVPSVLAFLEPEKTLERNTDSLRDFIISLDKAKADKLRYKVEDTVVKIFITPYRTSLSQQDLEFGQGDFNVDVVVALGVHHQDDLDEAITAHGRILHDATVVSINTDTAADGDLGSINWINGNVSSLSEMVADIAGDLGQENLIDNQIATALLTGIVAETERFGNAKTKPATMEAAAKLLTAGANQELVATKLSEPQRPVEPPRDNPGMAGIGSDDGFGDGMPIGAAPASGQENGTLEIEHADGLVEPGDSNRQASPWQPPQPSRDFQLPEEPGEDLSQAATTDDGSVPPIFGPGQLAPGDQQFTAVPVPEQPPHNEEEAALDYLKGRKVEIDRRARIEPLHDQKGYLEGDSVLNSSNTSSGSNEAGDGLTENRFALRPPSMGGTLTANLPGGQSLGAADYATVAPILSHGSEAPSDPEPKSAVSPAPAPGPVVPAVPAPALEAAPADAAPAHTPTLAEIEHQTHSKHAAAGATAPSEPAVPPAQPALQAALAEPLTVSKPADTHAQAQPGITLPAPSSGHDDATPAAPSTTPPPTVPPPLPPHTP